MFIQVVQGKTKDAEGLKRQTERWAQEVGPGAKGYLGSTAGVAEDGTVVVLARFESEAAAQANSESAAQTSWWNDTAKYFDGEPTFRNCTEVDSTLAGGSDDAGFVQVMQGTVKNKARMLEMEQKFMSQMQALRPDVIGTTRAWDGDFFTEAIYFTSEAEARQGEARMADIDAEGAAEMAEFMELSDVTAYIDLKDPWLRSP